MEMALTIKIVAKKYNCNVSKDNGFDDSHKFWVALEKDEEDKELKFEYADGWTLQELVKNIESKIKVV
jgi:hypothetical protein